MGAVTSAASARSAMSVRRMIVAARRLARTRFASSSSSSSSSSVSSSTSASFPASVAFNAMTRRREIALRGDGAVALDAAVRERSEVMAELAARRSVAITTTTTITTAPTPSSSSSSSSSSSTTSEPSASLCTNAPPQIYAYPLSATQTTTTTTTTATNKQSVLLKPATTNRILRAATAAQAAHPSSVRSWPIKHRMLLPANQNSNAGTQAASAQGRTRELETQSQSHSQSRSHSHSHSQSRQTQIARITRHLPCNNMADPPTATTCLPDAPASEVRCSSGDTLVFPQDPVPDHAPQNRAARSRRLPAELLCIILSSQQLTSSDILNASLVCFSWYKIAIEQLYLRLKDGDMHSFCRLIARLHNRWQRILQISEPICYSEGSFQNIDPKLQSSSSLPGLVSPRLATPAFQTIQMSLGLDKSGPTRALCRFPADMLTFEWVEHMMTILRAPCILDLKFMLTHFGNTVQDLEHCSLGRFLLQDIETHCPNLQSLDLDFSWPYPDSEIAFRLPNLRRLRLRANFIGQQWNLAKIPVILAPLLQHLSIHLMDVADSQLVQIIRASNGSLLTLTIELCDSTTWLALLPKLCPNIRKISICGIRSASQTVIIPPNLHNLTHLRLSHQPDVEPPPVISHASRLVHLSITGKWGDATIAALINPCTLLTTLHLESSTVTSPFLISLAKKFSLRQLTLTSISPAPTANFFHQFPQTMSGKTLEHLCISDCRDLSPMSILNMLTSPQMQSLQVVVVQTLGHPTWKWLQDASTYRRLLAKTCWRAWLKEYFGILPPRQLRLQRDFQTREDALEFCVRADEVLHLTWNQLPSVLIPKLLI